MIIVWASMNNICPTYLPFQFNIRSAGVAYIINVKKKKKKKKKKTPKLLSSTFIPVLQKGFEFASYSREDVA